MLPNTSSLGEIGGPQIGAHRIANNGIQVNEGGYKPYVPNGYNYGASANVPPSNNRDQRVAQPKRENSRDSRAKYDSFLDNPQMSKSPNEQSRQYVSRGAKNGSNTYTGPLSKSQDRFAANAGNDYDDVNQASRYEKMNSGVMSARPTHTRNASASVAHNDSFKNDLVNQSSKVRPMPVHERENVFNEWGAVIKHQDEIDRELRRQHEEKLRERQKNYKMQLDMQYNEYLNKKKGSVSEIAKKEENMLKMYNKDLEDKRRQEDEKRNQIINRQKEAAYHSIHELSSIKKQQESIREMERQLYHNKMKRQEDMEAQRRMEEKEKSKSDQANYSRILQIQHKSKMDKLNTEKAANRHFSEAEKKQMDKIERQRDQFFQKLNKIQEVNDLKQKKLQEYMEQDPKEMRSKQDEVNYIKGIQVTEKKNQMKDHESKTKKELDQMKNYRSLAQQLQEKQLQEENVKVQENAIADYYTKEADKYRQEIEQDKQNKQKQKELYYKALSDQINDNNKKKQYSVLMSEHERRVNDRDIKAYEYMDTTNLYSKVIGFAGDNRMDKYIEQSMKINGGSAKNSPTRSPQKSQSLDNSFDQGSNLARMGQMSLNKSNNIITDGTDPSRAPQDNSYPMTKLQRVRENMEKQDAFKYRANTNNRGYGFEQNINKEPPQHKMVPRQGDANPYEYNFVAPGNY